MNTDFVTDQWWQGYFAGFVVCMFCDLLYILFRAMWRARNK